MVQTDTLIVGGGLAGLSLAAQLTAAGRDFALVEARPRFGGRIEGQTHGSATFDMGPAWFWPGQPRIAALIQRLGLVRFDQHATGELMFEDERGQTQRGRGFASMDGSYRLQGGLSALTAALVDEISPDRLHLNTAIVSVAQSDNGIIAASDTNAQFRARRVVLALPPRVAATLSFAPALHPNVHQTMTDIATWMAGQAKAMVVYDRPFWREAGLSGDAMSRRGPLAEIHDASPENGGPYALFGFVGVPPQARRDAGALKSQVMAQLVRLFGEAAAQPAALYIKDWASDPRTATPDDLKPLYAHPRYGLPHALADLWDGRILFGGTEVAPQFGGYVEGALEAAEAALNTINRDDAGTPLMTDPVPT